MSLKQRAWWPAMPDGGNHQTSGTSQQVTQKTSHWDAIELNLSRAMPWASPERIQAQRAKLTSQTAVRKQGLDDSLEENSSHYHSQFHDPSAFSLLTPGPAAEYQSCSGKALGPAQVNSNTAAQPPHVLYAALFLSSEQQRVLLNRQVSTGCMPALRSMGLWCY